MIVDSSQLDAKFLRGHEAHRAGDLGTASSLYQEILAAKPDHAQALHALGNINARQGDLKTAEKRIRKAIEIDALGAGFHNSLGNVLVGQDRDDEALTAYQAELRIRPDFAVAHNQIGTLFLKTGQADSAIHHFQLAIQHAPTFAVAANNLGGALVDARRFDQAADALRHALRLAPNMPPAHANLGHALRERGEHEPALKSFARALQLDGSLASAHRGVALCRLRDGAVQEAEAAFKKAIENNPGDRQSLHELGKLYTQVSQLDVAREYLERALALAPSDPDLICDTAAVSRSLGDDRRALALYQSALVNNPTHEDALCGSAQLTAAAGDDKAAVARLASSVNSGRAGPDLLKTYAQLLGGVGRRREGIALLESALQKTWPEAVAGRLHFALAGLLHSEGSYDLAFYHCRRANALSNTKFDVEKFNDRIQRLIAAPVQASESAPGRNLESGAQPVFAVGLPGSGLRVVETLLASNEHIESRGVSTSLEFKIRDAWTNAGGQWPDEDVMLSQDALRSLAQTLESAKATTRYVLDASWRNFFYLGEIQKLHAGARIIEIVRDPRDVALSCYFRDMADMRGLPFANDLGHIATCINGYRRLMRHWRSTLAMPWLVVEYEKLITMPEETISRISEFLGPDAGGWAGDSATTLNLYAKSLRRHRHYPAHLEEFVDALDAQPGENR